MTNTSPVPRALRTLARAALAGALALTLLCSPAIPAFAQEGEVAVAEPAGEASTGSITGTALLLDDQTILDRVAVQLANVPPAPAGSRYRVWLRSEDQKAVQLAGELDVASSGEAVLVWSQPAGESLFLQFSQVLVTLEPEARAGQPGAHVVLQGRVDAGVLTQARRLLVRWPDSRYGTASLQGLRRLTAIARAQTAVLAEAAAAADLATMQRKAEHLVNLVEGNRGAFFADHNADGRAEDPGDGVGILPYTWGALTQSQFAWAGAVDDNVAEQALTLQPALRFGLDWTGFVRDAGIELTRTRDLARARELTEHIVTATARFAAAADARGDEALQQVLDERGLTAAYDQAQALVRLTLAPPA